MDDSELVRQFEARTLPFAQWTHRAHVRVAFSYLRAHSFDEALLRMRTGVKAYNAANKVPESPTSGYNETTTHAFLHLIAATIAAYGDVFPTETGDAFCDAHPQLMTATCCASSTSTAAHAPPRQDPVHRARLGAASKNERRQVTFKSPAAASNALIVNDVNRVTRQPTHVDCPAVAAGRRRRIHLRRRRRRRGLRRVRHVQHAQADTNRIPHMVAQF
jgi:hypothetical protein